MASIMFSSDLIIPILLMVFGSAGILWGIHSYKVFSQIKNIPTSKIRSLAMGLVEVKGTISFAPKLFLKSPFSNSKCVHYSYAVYKYVTTKDKSYWKQISSGFDSVRFYIKDNTGKVLVDPTGASITPAHSSTEFSRGAPTQRLIKQFLGTQGFHMNSFFGFGERYKYVESYITQGDEMYILGTAGDNPDVKEGTGKNNTDDIMIQKGNSYFYVSSGSEKNILFMFKVYTFLGLVGGFLFFVGGMVLSFSILGIL